MKRPLCAPSHDPAQFRRELPSAGRSTSAVEKARGARLPGVRTLGGWNEAEAQEEACRSVWP